MPRNPRSKDDLLQRLTEQLQFLSRSADAFDGGLTDEAKRLAVAIRILVHDHGSSRSVLGQLGLLDRNFVSTTLPHDARNVATWCGLLTLDVGTPLSDTYLPPLDGMLRRSIPFADWWANEIVIVDDLRNTMTRRDLVLTMCDQDGGAHVDPSLDEAYERLSPQLAQVVPNSGLHKHPTSRPGEVLGPSDRP